MAVNRYSSGHYDIADSFDGNSSPHFIDAYGNQSPSDERDELSGPHSPASDAAFWEAQGLEELPRPGAQQAPIVISAVHNLRLLPAHERPINHPNGHNSVNTAAVGQADGSFKTQEEVLAGGGGQENAYISSPQEKKPASTPDVSTEEVRPCTQGSVHSRHDQGEPQAPDGAKIDAQRTLPVHPTPARLEKPSQSSDDSHQGRGEAKAANMERRDAHEAPSAEDKPSILERISGWFQSKLERVLGNKA